MKDLGGMELYVVIRQLEQDVRAFWRYVEEAARTLRGTGHGVAEAMVGRTLADGVTPGRPRANPPKIEGVAKRKQGERDNESGINQPLSPPIRMAWVTKEERKRASKVWIYHYYRTRETDGHRVENTVVLGARPLSPKRRTPGRKWSIVALTATNNWA